MKTNIQRIKAYAAMSEKLLGVKDFSPKEIDEISVTFSNFFLDQIEIADDAPESNIEKLLITTINFFLRGYSLGLTEVCISCTKNPKTTKDFILEAVHNRNIEISSNIRTFARKASKLKTLIRLDTGDILERIANAIESREI